MDCFLGGRFLKKILLRKLSFRCKGKLVLTYDDGPGQRLEPKILEVLKLHNAKATFFLNGTRVERYPHRCEVLKQDGHELGCHCYSHLNAWKVPPWCVVNDINKAYKTLSQWIEKDAVFRFPYGRPTVLSWLKLKIQGAPVAFWTIDSGDTKMTLPDMGSIVLTALGTKGAVVLMHSFDRIPESKERESYVINLTKALLESAKEHHLEICTWSEMWKSSI